MMLWAFCIRHTKYINKPCGMLGKQGPSEMDMLHVLLKTILKTRKFGWPTATLFLAPVEGWKGPSGPAWDLCPHLK